MGSYKLNAREKSIIDAAPPMSIATTFRQLQGSPNLAGLSCGAAKAAGTGGQRCGAGHGAVHGRSLNTFAKPTNVDTNARILCYDIRDLGKQLLPIGMLVVLDSIFNRSHPQPRLGKLPGSTLIKSTCCSSTSILRNFLFTLWKRVRKYGACCTGITQNIGDLLQSHTARTMLANSEFLVLLNQAPTDRLELAKLLNISDDQLSYITDVEVGHGLLKCGSTLVPFEDNFPRNTQLYKLMSTKPSDQEL